MSQIQAPVPVKYLRNLLRLAAAQGVDTDALCRRVGFDGNPLRTAESLLELDAETYSRLYGQLARALDDECFGFYRARPLPLGSLAQMTRIMASCLNLEQALREAERYFSLLYRSPRYHSVRRDDDGAHLIYPELESDAVSGNFSRQNGIAGALASWHRLCAWLIGQPIPLTRVELRGAKAVDIAKFERIFRCPLAFDARADALHFSAHYLDAPIVQGPEQLAAFLKIAPYQLVALREIDADRHLSVSHQVLQLVDRDIDNAPGFEELAARLGLSPRTLRRRLEQEDTSYQELKDHSRCRLATALLRDSSLSVADIASRLGFDEPSAFHRAFKRWTGQTPGRYRERP